MRDATYCRCGYGDEGDSGTTRIDLYTYYLSGAIVLGATYLYGYEGD